MTKFFFFFAGALVGAASLFGFLTLQAPTIEQPVTPPCCYVPGKGVQVCAEPGALMLPEETGHFRSVRK